MNSDDPLLVPVGAETLAALVLVHFKTALFTKVTHSLEMFDGIITGCFAEKRSIKRIQNRV